MGDLKVTVLSKEFPPDIYGGAGVHVDYLTGALRKLMDVEVRCFGSQSISEQGYIVRGYQAWQKLLDDNHLKSGKVLDPLSTDLAMVKEAIDSDVVHAHTWYTFWAGFLAKKLYDIPLVTTIHSLEPLRPWKEEQLGNGYYISSWMEKMGIENSDRVIAVSKEMKSDILKHYNVREDKIVEIYNGIDLKEYQEVNSSKALKKYNIKNDYILFVGRISRQKGILHLLNAIEYLPEDIDVVLCAGKADTEKLLKKVKEKVKTHKNIIWINEMISRKEIIELYSQASVFVCPSIYEPFGIINLEAMACKTPVVASSVGGIKEVVVNGETGFLITAGAEKEMAEAIIKLLDNQNMRNKFGKAGRNRVEKHFSWDSIARQTKKLYESLV